MTNDTKQIILVARLLKVTSLYNIPKGRGNITVKSFNTKLASGTILNYVQSLAIRNKLTED